MHTTDDTRFRWLNDLVCAVEGEVRPRTDGPGFEVVLEVSEMVWEGVGWARSVSLAYLRTERVDYLLIVDLVWIVPLLSLLVHRSA